MIEFESQNPIDTKVGDNASGRVGVNVPSTGKRKAFQDIRTQLTEVELSNPGVQKLLLEMLEEAERRCCDLEVYVTRFHEADKQASILEEKLASQTIIEIFFGVGLAVGGAILGLAPFFWNIKDIYGIVTLLIGALLMLGSTLGRSYKK